MIYCFILIGGTVALIIRDAICWECNCDHPVFMIYRLILFGHCCFDSPRLFAESVLAGFHDLLFWFTALICGECNFKYLAFMIYCFILIGGCCFNSPFCFCALWCCTPVLMCKWDIVLVCISTIFVCVLVAALQFCNLTLSTLWLCCSVNVSHHLCVSIVSNTTQLKQHNNKPHTRRLGVGANKLFCQVE